MSKPFLRHWGYAELVGNLMCCVCEPGETQGLSERQVFCADLLRADLSDAERDTLYGIYVLGLTMAKIACELNLNHSALYSVRRTGEKKVKQRLLECADVSAEIKAYCRDEPPAKSNGRYGSRLNNDELYLLEQAAHPERDNSLSPRRLVVVTELRRKLSPSTMDCMADYYLLGMTVEMLAVKYGLNISSVSRRLTRGRNRIHKLMDLLYKIESGMGGDK